MLCTNILLIILIIGGIEICIDMILYLQYYLIIVLLSLAGHFKGKLDAISDNGLKDEEWRNKYDLNKPKNYKHWWYFGLYNPKFPEKFPFSTTILVFLTDTWHRYQFFTLRCFYLSIAVALTLNIWLILLLSCIVFPIIVGVFFEHSYNKLK